MKKKIMAGLLAFCMVVTMLPLTAFAADHPTPGQATLEADGFKGLPSTYAYDGKVPAVTGVTYSKSHTVKADAAAQGDNAETLTQTIAIATGDITLSYKVEKTAEEPGGEEEASAQADEPELVAATADNCVVGTEVHVFAAVSAKASTAATDAVTGENGAVTTPAKDPVVGYAALTATEIGTFTITAGARELAATLDDGYTLTTGEDAAAVDVSLEDNASEQEDYDASEIKITSSDTSVVTVANEEGTLKLTPVKAGGPVTITITAPATANFAAGTATFNVIVGAAEQTITVTEKNDGVTINATDTNPTKKLTVSGNKGTLQFTSSDTSVATVDKDGNITGLKAGTATITVKALANDQYAESAAVEVAVTVTATPAVTITGFDTTAKQVQVGSDTINAKPEGLKATYADAAGNVTDISAKLKFKSSNTEVATVVEGTGVVTIVAPGTTNIIAYVEASEEPAYAAAEVSFELTVTAIAVTKDDVTITLAVDDTDTDESDPEYTGEAIEPEVSVTYGDDELTADDDYTVAYTNNINVGTATVTITFTGDYSGTVTKTFAIAKGTVEGGITAGGESAKIYVNPNSGSASVDLSNISADMPADAVISNVQRSGDELYMTGVTVSGKTLNMTFDTSRNHTESSTITATVSSKNVNDFTLTLTVTYTDNEVPTVSTDSVTVKFAEKLAAGSGECNALTDEEAIAAHKAAEHKCYDKGYRLATVREADQFAIFYIITDGSITMGSETLPTGVTCVAVSDLAEAGIDDDDETHHYYKVTANQETAVAGTVVLSFTVAEGTDYTAGKVYVSIVSEKVALVEPLEEEEDDNTTTDPDPVDPTPVDPVEPTVDETGAIEETEVKADEPVSVKNESAGVAVNVPATGIEGTVSGTVAKDEETGEITVDIKVNGETVEIPVDATLEVSEEQAAAGDKLVAYVVDENGNKTALPKSVMTEDGLKTQIPNGSKIVLEEAKNELTGLDETSEDAAAAITFVADRGIMMGKDGNHADADANTTRYEVAVFLHRLEMEAAVDGGNSFGDVMDGQWYSNAASWATSNGIVQGSDDAFDGEREVKRIEFILMLYRYAKEFAPQVLGNGKDYSFTDVPNWGDETVEAVRWAYGNNIFLGNDSAESGIMETATRWQIATYLQRFLKAL